MQYGEMETTTRNADPKRRPLRKWRNEQGLTLDALARKLGIDTGTLSRIERGQIRRPSPDVITKLEDMSNGELTYRNIVSG